jgi:hypothetical protein
MYLRSEDVEWMNTWGHPSGLEVAAAAAIVVGTKINADSYAHVRTSIRQGPEKKMKQNSAGYGTGVRPDGT